MVCFLWAGRLLLGKRGASIFARVPLAGRRVRQMSLVASFVAEFQGFQECSSIEEPEIVVAGAQGPFLLDCCVMAGKDFFLRIFFPILLTVSCCESPPPTTGIFSKCEPNEKSGRKTLVCWCDKQLNSKNRAAQISFAGR